MRNPHGPAVIRAWLEGRVYVLPLEIPMQSGATKCQQEWQALAATARAGLQRRVATMDSLRAEDLPDLLAACQMALQLEQGAACLDHEIEKALNRPPYED